jgi:hypothetical protein
MFILLYQICFDNYLLINFDQPLNPERKKISLAGVIRCMDLPMLQT